ncbi:hypothetical protein KUG88_28870 [Rhodococcus rhodochrous]|uniref:hypothetical protein n=1 Tax=Rhodococcus rhodochrous TaxID=1829 RepID=UPI001E3FF996|nr:hypothetical protein [Rhodococcus rhodochrous]MCB8914108.1 hypothetical protein [Rhodococcus rhodochrous]
MMHIPNTTPSPDGHFEIERRGYAKDQVDRYISESRHREIKLLEMVEHLKRDLQTVTQQRNWEINLSQEKNTRLEYLQGKVEQLTAYTEELIHNPTSKFTLGPRIQSIFTLAEEESRSTLEEAKRQAGELLREAQDKAEKVAESSERQRMMSRDLELKAQSEYTKELEKARAEARLILKEAERLKSEARIEALDLKSATEAALQVEADEKRRKVEAFLRNLEDEALKNARNLVEAAEQKVSEMLREAQLTVAAHRRNYNLIELSRTSSIWQITTMRDALAQLMEGEPAEVARD